MSGYFMGLIQGMITMLAIYELNHGHPIAGGIVIGLTISQIIINFMRNYY